MYLLRFGIARHLNGLLHFGIGICIERTYCVLELRFFIRKYCDNLQEKGFFVIQQRDSYELRVSEKVETPLLRYGKVFFVLVFLIVSWDVPRTPRRRTLT